MRAAIVTGASSGVGTATAVELASRGFHVVGLDASDGAALRGAAEFAGVAGSVGSISVDLTDRGEVALAMARITASFNGRLDALVTCADMRAEGPFSGMPPWLVRQQFDVNLAGAMNTARAALPDLRATAGSCIVALSSSAGLGAVPGMAAYCGTKWGLEGWLEALSHELRPLGVAVTLVEPGLGGATGGGGDMDQVAAADAVVAAVEGGRRLRRPVGTRARARCLARGIVPAGLQHAVAGRATGVTPASHRAHDEGVVLVTGCSSGFGLATVVELARRGRRVAATMRDTGDRGALDWALADEGLSDRVEVLRMDVADPGSVDEVFATVDRWAELAGERGRLVGVVNNAGVRAVGAFEEIPPAEVDAMMEVNLFGTLSVTRAAIARMEGNGGRIAFVSSSSALVGEPTWSAYAATKWAVEGWAESLAFEAGPLGIDLVLVEPGAYPTGLSRPGTRFGSEDGPYGLLNEAMEDLDEQQEKRAGDPAEVARVVSAAMGARRTPVRRPVGRDAWARWVARGVVPSGMQRWLRERSLGLQ